MARIVSFESGKWYDQNHVQVTDLQYPDKIDIEMCDPGWRHNLNKAHNKKSKPIPGGVYEQIQK